jgi:hypothetical protein
LNTLLLAQLEPQKACAHDVAYTDGRLGEEAGLLALQP